MTVEVKHQFVSLKGDGPDSTIVRPSDWNATHNFSMSGPAMLGKITSGAGVPVEIPIGAGLAFQNGTLVNTVKSLPIGLVLPLAGSYEPPGWLKCDGRAVSRTEYAALYSICGDKFGAGDGTSTFNIPDMRGRVPAGRDDIGGVAANRLTTATFPTGANNEGKTSGTERHVLTKNQLAAHSHIAVPANHYHWAASSVEGGTSSPHLTTNQAILRKNFGAGEASYTLHGQDQNPNVGWTSYQRYPEGVEPEDQVVIENTGISEPHMNLQPSITMNFIIFTGVYPAT